MLTRAQRRRVEETCARNNALPVALTVAWGALGERERSALRESSIALRDMADKLTVALTFNTFRDAHAAAAARGATSYVRGVLMRGGRPNRLVLGTERRFPSSERMRSWLSMLHDFAAASYLRHVVLNGVPLTVELVAAIAAAARQLSDLTVSFCKALSSGGSGGGAGGSGVGAGGSSGSAGGTSGGSLPLATLLRNAAPTLQRFDMTERGGDWAPELSQALQGCTQLQSVRLDLSSMPFAAALPAMVQLPALRSLNLVCSFRDTTPATLASAARIAGDLARLTQLTELCLFRGGFARITADALVPSVARLTGLTKLGMLLKYGALRLEHLQQLQALTALTGLHCDGLQLGSADPTEADESAGPELGLQQQSPQLAAQPLPLPSRLCTLVLDGCITPSALLPLSLQLPPGITTLAVGGLDLSACGHFGSQMRHAHAQQVLDACALLAARADPRGQVGRTLRLSACGLRPPPTWAGGYDALFATLRPMALRQLWLERVPMLNLGALMERFPLLEELELNCGVELHDVPSLSRLQNLDTLHLHAACDGSWEGWGDEEAVFRALEGLVRDAPALKRLRLRRLLSYNSDAESRRFDKRVFTATKAAVARLLEAMEKGSLQRRCRDRLSASTPTLGTEYRYLQPDYDSSAEEGN